MGISRETIMILKRLLLRQWFPNVFCSAPCRTIIALFTFASFAQKKKTPTAEQNQTVIVIQQIEKNDKSVYSSIMVQLKRIYNNEMN